MRLLVALALTLLLPSIAAGQAPDETPDERASLVQGSIRGAMTYLERVAEDLVRGDTAQARRDLNQLRGRLRATETNVLVLRVLVRDLVLDTITPPIVVIPPDDPPPPVVVPPVPVELWDSTLIGPYVGDVIVPPGQRWRIGPNVTIAGNLRTDGGLIGMRPGSSLKFEGANPLEYVGGGMGFDSIAFRRDVGLWIGGTGILDIRGSEKLGWNRECESSSWSMGTDEIYLTPTAPGDFTPRRWVVGVDTIVPQFDPRVPPAECINVTRDITIEGPGHIHISSNQRQRIEWVTLRSMGIVNQICKTVCGRYALHFHMMGEGSSGSVVRGVAAIDSKGTVHVAHSSDDITYEDVVCVNSFASCFWSDKGARTNNVTIDRLASSGTYVDRSITGQSSRNSAVVLGCGAGNSISNSAVSGVRGPGEKASGFEWFPCNRDQDLAVWQFSAGLVSHNTQGPGIRFWTNSGQPHVVTGTVTYNSGSCILNGAYANALRYFGVICIGGGGISHNTSTKPHQVDGGPGRYDGVEVYAASGPAVIVSGQNLPTQGRWEFLDCKLIPGPGAPVVQVNRTANPWVALFRNCGVTPADFQFAADAIAGHSIWIEEPGQEQTRWKFSANSRTLTRDRD